MSDGRDLPVAIHTCHVPGCERRVPPKLLMCTSHWHMVPQKLRNAVWNTYREGQEVDKAPSREYLTAAQAAIRSVVVALQRQMVLL